MDSPFLLAVQVNTEGARGSSAPALEIFHKPDPERLVQAEPIVNPQQILVPQQDQAPGPEAQPNLDELDEPQRGAREFGFKLKEDASRLDQKARDAALEVFVVPHSHCDAGWLKTFDEYHRQEVQHILTSVTEALSRRADRKFSWVEVGFLDKWWRVQSTEEKARFRGLFEKGQLEFLMGGWVSHDEATVTYMQAINQMTAGHTYLQREFGPRAVPRIGWQIDPFGLSQVTATLFSQMCFDADAAWRTCQGTDMKDFVDQKLLEFIWRGSPTLETSSDLLLHLLPWSYVAPPEFLFEKPGGLNLNSASSVAQAANKLVDSFKERATYYPSNTLMWPWGHDFMFVDAHKMFDNMDKLLDYINSHPEYKVRVRYGTPTEYFQALHDEQVRFPMLVRDFLPYGPTEVNWWVGFYSSRPLLKRMCRYLDDIQRTAEVMYTWGRTSQKSALAEKEWTTLFHQLESVRHVQGIMQHHDAITGTMKEHVLHDYYHMLERANLDTMDVMERMGALLSSSSSTSSGVHALRPQETLVISSTDSGTPFMVMNSLAWKRKEIIELFVNQPRVEIYDPRSQTVLPSSVLPPLLKSDGESTGFRVYFALELESVGYRVIHVRGAPQRTFADVSISQSPLWAPSWKATDMPGIQVYNAPTGTVQVESDRIHLQLDATTGQVTEISQPGYRDRKMKLRKEFWEYRSDGAWDNHYTFKAAGNGQLVTPKNAQFYVVRSPLIQEVVSQVNGQLLHRFTLKQGQGVVQVTDMVGPPTTGMNYVTRYATDLPTDGHFYTDDSGLEIVARTYDSKRIYSANYYPLVYSSFLRTDLSPLAPERASFQQVSLVVDRTHGVTSPEKGMMDVLLHRNSLQPFGNGEKMNDQNRVEMTSWLLVTPEDNYHRQQWSMRMNFAPTILRLDGAASDLRTQRAFLSASLPDDVFLTNLEYYTVDEETVTLRVNNLRQNAPFEIQQGAAGAGGMSLEQSVSLAHLFAQGGEPHLLSVEERSLSLNQPAGECQRHHWHDQEEIEDHSFRFGDVLPLASNALHQLTLTPLAIRSFFAHFAK